jgi:hypothetical protein
LAAPDKGAQSYVIAFGALRFLDRALAHLDRKRHPAHGERVGGIRAGPARSRDQPFGEIGQRGLVEERGHEDDLRFVCKVEETTKGCGDAARTRQA